VTVLQWQGLGGSDIYFSSLFANKKTLFPMIKPTFPYEKSHFSYQKTHFSYENRFLYRYLESDGMHPGSTALLNAYATKY
jgi:hypothetical protein